MASSNVLRLTIAVVCVVGLLLSLVQVSEANYKNAPMNGIMFGKRGPLDYDNRAKTFTAFCEIAIEACQSWFPSQESKPPQQHPITDITHVPAIPPLNQALRARTGT